MEHFRDNLNDFRDSLGVPFKNDKYNLRIWKISLFVYLGLILPNFIGHNLNQVWNISGLDYLFMLPGGVILLGYFAKLMNAGVESSEIPEFNIVDNNWRKGVKILVLTGLFVWLPYALSILAFDSIILDGILYNLIYSFTSGLVFVGVFFVNAAFILAVKNSDFYSGLDFSKLLDLGLSDRYMFAFVNLFAFGIVYLFALIGLFQVLNDFILFYPEYSLLTFPILLLMPGLMVYPYMVGFYYYGAVGREEA